MSIVINLLPDLRQKRLLEQRQRRLASVIAIMVSAISVGLVLLLVIFSVGQKVIIDNLSKDITSKEQSISSINDVTNALTAQEHLNTLPNIWAQRVFLTKFFEAYVQVNPTDVTLNGLSITSANILQVTGTAGSYKSVSKLAEAMMQENVSFGANAKATNRPYFTNVNIQSVSASDQGSVFSITALLSSETVSGN
jgi:Tfp pilus assembly protein PilN